RPERPLRSPHAVSLGGIEAVDAEVEGAVDGARELGFFDVAVAARDLPAAEPDGRDLEPGPAERSVFHRRLPLRRLGPRARKLTVVSPDRSTGRSAGLPAWFTPGETNGSGTLAMATPRTTPERPGGGPAAVRRAPFSDNPRVGARGQRTQQRILDAALRAFGEKGYHGCSIDRITKLARCSRVSFYQYFASKEDVFQHLA